LFSLHPIELFSEEVFHLCKESLFNIESGNNRLALIQLEKI